MFCFNLTEFNIPWDIFLDTSEIIYFYIGEIYKRIIKKKNKFIAFNFISEIEWNWNEMTTKLKEISKKKKN